MRGLTGWGWLVTILLADAALGGGGGSAVALEAEPPPVCQVGDLALLGAWQGATMNLVGAFVLRNTGALPCLMQPPGRDRAPGRQRCSRARAYH